MNWKLLIIVIAVLLVGLWYALVSLPEVQDAGTVPAPVTDGHDVRECSSGEECGVPGFTGVYACRGDNVFGEYVTYICFAAGNSSKCVEVTSMEYIKNCAREGRECVSGLRECQESILP